MAVARLLAEGVDQSEHGRFHSQFVAAIDRLEVAIEAAALAEAESADAERVVSEAVMAVYRYAAATQGRA